MSGMIFVTSHQPRGYHLDDRDAGVTLVRRNNSDACVGRVYPVDGPRSDGAWMAEMGHMRVMAPYTSLRSAVLAICIYADANPQISL